MKYLSTFDISSFASINQTLFKTFESDGHKTHRSFTMPLGDHTELQGYMRVYWVHGNYMELNALTGLRYLTLFNVGDTQYSFKDLAEYTTGFKFAHYPVLGEFMTYEDGDLGQLRLGFVFDSHEDAVYFKMMCPHGLKNIEVNDSFVLK